MGGIFKSQTAGKKIGVTPLNLTKAYINFEEYTPFVSYDQISRSSSEFETIVSTITKSSCHCIIIASGSSKITP
jgi:hypothetical protein